MAVVPAKMIYGSTTTVIDTSTDIAASNFSGSPSAEFNNTSDGTVPYALFAEAMLEAPDWAAAPTANTGVELWGVLKDVDGTDDDTDAPSGTAVNGAKYFGSWIIDDSDTLQRRTITISLLGVRKCDFYIKNATSQNMNNDGGTNCVVKITPFTIGVEI